jgi:hypothetical protein
MLCVTPMTSDGSLHVLTQMQHERISESVKRVLRDLVNAWLLGVRPDADPACTE